MTNFINKQDQVIQGGYCVGCGACAIGGSAFKMEFNDSGQYIPVRMTGSDDSSKFDLDRICPFSTSYNEDKLSKEFIAKDVQTKQLKHLGFFDKCYAGHVKRGDFRERGSSGGMVSWIATELYKQDKIDGLIHVRESSKDGSLFEYAISNNTEEIQKGAKSRYYPVKIDEVFTQILDEVNETKRYAIVGVPCFIKSVRLLMKENKKINESIAYCIGIVCGHLKSKSFAEYLSWQQGRSPGSIETVDFRRKLKYRGASSYGFSSTSKKGQYKVTPMAALAGGDWGQGLFKLKSCDYCDDVFAETADVVIGDAWLPKYRKDSKGTNVVLSRNKSITEIIDQAISKGDLELDIVSAETVLQSQASGVRHRDEGLIYRLREKHKNGISTPKKRVELDRLVISADREEIYRIRERIRDMSHIVFAQARESGNLGLFTKSINPMLFSYKLITSKSLKNVYKSRILNLANNLIRKLTGTYNKEIYTSRKY